MKILINGPVPSKKNSKIMVCRGRVPILLPSTKYTTWHKDALLQLSGVKPIKSKKITLTFIAGDNRKFDLSNKCESIMDLLVDAGLIEDDNYSIVEELTLKFGGVEKGCAKCLIEY
jgi:Holliday junction resolvase RusA-like endonuclease